MLQRFEWKGSVARRGLRAALAALALALGCAVESRAQPAEGSAPAASSAPAAGGASASRGRESNALQWYIESEGVVFFLVQLGLGIAILSFIGINALGASRSRFVNPAFVEQFDAMVKNRQYKEAFELAKVENNFLGKVMTAGLSRLTDGYADAVTAVQEAGSVENMRNEHRLSILSMMANIATLVGLLGTVVGMVWSFKVLSYSDVAPPPSELAKGVSQALVTTVTGLVEAIPAIIAFTIFTNLNNKRVAEVGVAADALMRPFKQVAIGRKPAAAGAPGPGAGGPPPQGAGAAAASPASAGAASPAAAGGPPPAAK
jgi:biopolymer transport protein ExbB